MAVKEDAKLKAAADPIEEVAASAQDDKENLKEYEGDILSAILKAADYTNDQAETYKIRIVRDGVVLFAFKIHPLSEAQYAKCRDKNTKYVRNKRIGVKVPETTNAVRYRSQLIYEATAEEDRKAIWDNKAAWEKLEVASGVDAIDKILKSGEKDKIVEQIDSISGYGDELEETTKN